MPKAALTVGDIKEIEKYLEMQKNVSNDTTVKERIEALIKKLDETEILS